MILLQEHDNEAEGVVSSLMVAYDDDDLDIGNSYDLSYTFFALVSSPELDFAR